MYCFLQRGKLRTERQFSGCNPAKRRGQDACAAHKHPVPRLRLLYLTKKRQLQECKNYNAPPITHFLLVPCTWRVALFLPALCKQKVNWRTVCGNLTYSFNRRRVFYAG